MCVLCVCVGWWSFFTSSVSLHSPSIHCHYQFSCYYSFSFPVGAALLKKVSYLPSIHPFFSNPVVTDNSSLSFSMFSTCGLTGLMGTSTTETVLFTCGLTGLMGTSSTETVLFLIFILFF